MKKRYLIIIAVLALITGLIGLGLNHQNVISSARSIIAKDQAGDDITADLNKLSNYVHSHSRASVTFSLEGSYKRAILAAEQASIPTANPAVYAAAQKACQVSDAVKTARCMEAYVQSNSTPGTQPKPPVLPDHSAYVYRLNAPAWAPDLAGVSFLIALISLALAIWLGIMKTKTNK